MKILRIAIILLGLIATAALVFIVIAIGPKDLTSDHLLGFLILLVAVWLVVYILLWLTNRSNKRFFWLRILLAFIDTAVFYFLVFLFGLAFPKVGNLEFFIIASVILGFLEGRGIIKTTLGEKILKLKREKLGYEVSTNIKFREVPLRILSLFIPVQYIVRIFWVKETEGSDGWEDKAVEAKISKGLKTETGTSGNL